MRVPSFDDSPTADIDILAERNFECLMEYDADKEEKKHKGGMKKKKQMTDRELP